MNISDVPVEGLLEACYEHYGVDSPIAVIFARQSELIEKYHPIEVEVLGRTVPKRPFDLHDPVCQEALKARAWWFTEEIGEAFDALHEANQTKFLEEFSDALHFITELLIFAEVDPNRVHLSIMPKDWGVDMVEGVAGWEHVALKLRAFAIIGELAMGMWQLRNKPWKRSQVLTDIEHFQQRLVIAYSGFLALMIKHCNMDLEDIAVLYLRKSEVNRFRIRTHY